jgi:hypothetical protein
MEVTNYRRDIYLKKIIPFINKPVIKIITGIRRCGKSFLMKQIISELNATGIENKNILYINKELVTFNFIENYTHLYTYISEKFNSTQGKKYILIDEIQECPQAIVALRYFFEEMPDLHIIGAGSLLDFTLHS